MAGGIGRRAGDELPKQFHRLLGIPMLWWSVKAFHDEDPETEISVIMHPDFFEEFEESKKYLPDEFAKIQVKLFAGGNTRGESVANGLRHIPASENALVAVHDAARPLVSVEIIRNGWSMATKHKAVVPVTDVTDSLREKTGDDSKAVDRSRFAAVQTPQVFESGLLKEAYLLADSPKFTDDASRVEATGKKIFLFDGDANNIKVTNPNDFKIAEILLKR